MSVLKVVYFPDDPLTQLSKPIETFDRALHTLADNMFDTMHEYRGVGLAAPQIGRALRMFVLQEPEGPEMCIINPVILAQEGREEGEEGCLSMPEVYAQVPRATYLSVKAQDLDGNDVEFEANDFLARIIQHEYDHLDGILFPERLDIITRQEKLAEWNAVRERMLTEQLES